MTGKEKHKYVITHLREVSGRLKSAVKDHPGHYYLDTWKEHIEDINQAIKTLRKEMECKEK